MKWIIIVVNFFLITTAFSSSQINDEQDQNFKYYKFKTEDKIRISAGRYCGTDHKPNSQNILFVFPGKVATQNWKKFIAHKLASGGFDVWVLDFRGQGKSDRLVNNKQMVHINSFDDYIKDAEALVLNAEINSQNKKKFLYAHSMGGFVALSLIKKHQNIFEAAVLESPMITICTAPIPFFLAEPFASLMVNVFGRGKNYCFDKSDYDAQKETFEQNRNSREENIFNEYLYVPEADKEITPIGPSWGWAYAALTATRKLKVDLEKLHALKTSVFIGSAGDDRVLNIEFDTQVAQAYNAKHQRYDDSWHSLLHDSLETREKFLSDCLSFLKSHSHSH